MDETTLLKILGDNRQVKRWADIPHDERIDMRLDRIKSASLEDAAVAKILKDNLSTEEFALVVRWICKQTDVANNAGFQGGPWYVSESDFDKFLDDDTIVVLHDED